MKSTVSTGALTMLDATTAPGRLPRRSGVKMPQSTNSDGERDAGRERDRRLGGDRRDSAPAAMAESIQARPTWAPDRRGRSAPDRRRKSRR